MLPVLTALRKPEAFLKKYHAALPKHLKRFESVLDDTLSMEQQATALTALLHFFFYEYGMPMVLASQFAQARIKKLFADHLDEVAEPLLSLGTSLPGNKTAEMGALMFDLAASDAIRAHASAETFLHQLEGRTLDAEFLRQWDEFVAEYGARCPREIDAATPRPYERPAILFDQLKGMSAALDGQTATASIFETARKKRQAAYDTLYELALQKGKRQARSLAKLYKVWVTLGGYREGPKHYVIQVVDLFRQRALQVADRFVQAGRLDHRDQIFDLTITDMDRAFDDALLDLRALAAERTALINRIRSSHLVARVIDSRGKIYYPPRTVAQDGELPGVAISPGVVRGKVKVLHRADEKPLLPGEILVTLATDPGWTPLFINAAGIVLEIGGALQHGAVVAREYGIPCVSGLVGATDLLTDGQRVEVDGSRGVVRVLDGKIPASQRIND
jgi:pyruvate,water dikinase